MKRVLSFALIGAFGALAAVPSSALGAEYETYVGCSVAAGALPSHVCQSTNRIGLFFESPEADVTFEACVEFTGGEVCTEHLDEAKEGVLYVNEFTGGATGEYLATWRIEEEGGGEEVRSGPFRIEPPPPPPPPAPVSPPAAPPVVAPAPTEPTPACLQAEQQVKRWTARLKHAHGPKAKAVARRKLRRAKAAARQAC